uniref:Uncharacterized protein n=1 Tax=viral metagenome TaxID=1070528 RepID=A0A6C0HUG9_9ZZZZ
MIITLKLVGTNKETNINITSNTSIDDVSIVDIFNYLMENNLSYDEVSKLMFINNGTNISNDTNYKLTNESIIHIFINDFDIKKELLKYIFNKEDIKEEHDDNNFDDNDNDNHSNDNIIKLFSDNDFTYLLKICLTKPDLINKVSSYLLNGNITTEIKTINDNDFKYNDIYLQLVELLNKLNITKDEIEMKSVVQHFDGNLNLSLRYLITKY